MSQEPNALEDPSPQQQRILAATADYMDRQRGCACDAAAQPELLPVAANAQPPAVAATSPFDIAPAEFAAALDRRKQNRDKLLRWIKESLVEGIDFGRIHVVGRAKCQAGADCKNEKHWSKPTLFKPGAEKIGGMLGLTASYPTMADYEAVAVGGRPIKAVVLRCDLVDGQGRVVASGMGARDVARDDNGDLNRALKMASKSAQIDATLRCGGLSEVFTDSDDDEAKQLTWIKWIHASLRDAEIEPEEFKRWLAAIAVEDPLIGKIDGRLSMRAVSERGQARLRRGWAKAVQAFHSWQQSTKF